VELILVQATLQPEQKSVIALTRRIDCLLIDQQGIDHPTHLDELLPVPAIAGKARDFPGCYRSDLAETDLRHHPLKSGACNSTGRRAAEIVVDDFDLAPAKLAEPVPHGVLQDPALLIVHDLIPRALPNVQNGLAPEMMRFDLVTHRRALLPAPRRALRAGARAACAPSGASLSRAPPWAVGATPVSGCPVETDRAVKDDEGGPSVASASPSSAKE